MGSGIPTVMEISGQSSIVSVSERHDAAAKATAAIVKKVPIFFMQPNFFIELELSDGYDDLFAVETGIDADFTVIDIPCQKFASNYGQSVSLKIYFQVSYR